MVNNALGLIEIVGLAAALEAADAAVKAANVKLLGYELTKGGGLVVIKVSGNVGAVTAAIAAGKAAGSKVNQVWATHIIPRPHEQLACILPAIPKAEAFQQQEETEVAEVLHCETDEVVTVVPSNELQVQEEIDELLFEDELEEIDVVVSETPPALEQVKKPSYYCNLCGDPTCPRIKGDPKVTCIHYEKNMREVE